jgi:hypothetical protein
MIAGIFFKQSRLEIKKGKSQKFDDGIMAELFRGT